MLKILLKNILHSIMKYWTNHKVYDITGPRFWQKENDNLGQNALKVPSFKIFSYSKVSLRISGHVRVCEWAGVRVFPPSANNSHSEVKGRGPARNFKESHDCILFSSPLWSRKSGLENLPHISPRKFRCLYSRNYRKDIFLLCPLNNISYAEKAFYLALYPQTKAKSQKEEKLERQEFKYYFSFHKSSIYFPGWNYNISAICFKIIQWVGGRW